jgi:serine protease AprX
LVETRAPLSLGEAQQVKDLLVDSESTLREMRHKIYEDVTSETAADRTALRIAVEALGGQVNAELPLINALGVTVPADAVERLAKHPGVLEVSLDHEGAPELDVSVPTILKTTNRAAAPFLSAGFDGGIWDFGLCDTGVDGSHPALSAHPFYGESITSGDSHGTHVAGIVGSQDATYIGVACGHEAIVSRICGPNSSGAMVDFDWMINSSPRDADVGNLSWGFGDVATDDTPFSRFFDALVDGLDFMVAKSAGNGGNGGTSATLSYPANSYNILAVANMDDQDTAARSDDRIRSTSSQGPTPSGRKKPDITAPGTSIISSVLGDGFDSMSGTSMAAPHVAGSLLLLMDAGIYKPRTAKAILLNTADAWSSTGPVTGSSWNKVYGWGYLDLEEAEFNLNDYIENSVSGTRGSDAYDTFEGVMFTGEKATLVWDRSADDNGSSAPTTYSALKNLNLYMYDKATGRLIASSVSTKDNVEQVGLSSKLARYSGKTVQIKVKSAFAGTGTQPYTLATEENFVQIN